ncbi:S8 family peptidase [Paenibacillus sp. SC116]|uniref:S8 family peptidase n=1 Tax=Paenibacillus sp. SC116 TaxID=2968986 RepID=UPI00215B74CE|nr:S8 family peptidase [Paenibacillus sp. SC116]MCR8846556.1 S8 family peptidase [Paenibacillus sp. SC116]
MDVSVFLHLLLQEISSGGQGLRPYLIGFNDRSLYERCRKALKELRYTHPALAHMEERPIISSLRFHFPKGLEQRWRPFKQALTVEEDTRMMINTAFRTTSTGERGIPWGVRHIKAPLAWSTTTGHRIRIGVIDTGADYHHPDLRHSLLSGINFVQPGRPPQDDNGHGTHIAGTIAAANQMYGIIGVAPRALIHPVKSFDENGSAYVSDIVQGIEWCVRNKLHLINMSFGMKTRSKSLLHAVTQATNAGIAVVASSGNDAKRKTIDYPARYSQTISVGATDNSRRIAPFSNRGTYVDIYAPGEKIVSAWLHGNYHEMSGTSMATSHVSGAIALLLALKPDLKPPEIKALLRRTSNPIHPLRGRASSNKEYPAGEIDIARLLNECR